MRAQTFPRKSCAVQWLVPLFSLALLLGCGDHDMRPTPYDGDILENDGFAVDEAGIRADLDGGVLNVRIPLRAKVDGAIPLSGYLNLVALDGQSLGTAGSTLSLDGEGQMTFRLSTDAALGGGQSMGYVLKWQVYAQRGWVSSGRRSLYGALSQDQIFLLSSDTFFAGSRANVRLIAQDATTHEVLALRPAVVTLTDGTAELRAEGMTDEVGSVALPIDIPEDAQGNWELTATVDSRTGPVQMQASVAMRRESRVLLTTDKPFYQPGQTIHVRVLAMRRPALIPEADEPVTIEIQDPKGNKLARQVDTTDDFGVAYTELKLAREVTFGTYRIFATVGDTTSERAVTVERYALPKFKVSFESERPYYRPGETLHGTVRSGYFFGKPVAGGQVTVTAWKFDIGFESFAEVMGTLDAEGNWDFDLPLPTFFVGQPLEQGDAFVRLDIAVTDGAGHTQTLTRNVAISTRALLVQAVPATDIVPGVSLDMFVLVADPTGRPLEVSGTATTDGANIAFQTDARGIGKVTFPADAVTARQLSGQLTIEQGETPVTEAFTVGYGVGDDHALAIRADRALYMAGDTATLDVFATSAIQRIFLDVLKDNQIVLSTAADVERGAAHIDLDLPGDLVGNLQFEAYAVAPDGNIIRSHALVFVEAATDLQLTVTPAEEEYLPGDLATLFVDVRDSEGDGVVSSVGMMVVDEAVFALQDFRPGMEKVYFQLEQEILEPRYEIHSHSAEEILRTDPDVTEEERDTIAELVFASSAGMSAYGVNIDSFAQTEQVASNLAQQAQNQHAQELLAAARNATTGAADVDAAIDTWVAQQAGHWLDPWGQPYTLTRDYAQLTVKGRGPDELANTADDFTAVLTIDWLWQNNGGWNNGGNNGGWNDGAANNGWDNDGAGNLNNGTNNVPSENNGSEEGPRVRSYFPETLYVNPAIITDADGHASIEVPMADSITTWRVTATASSQDGGLGSFLGGVRVFQPFFVDINFPATLTAADEVTVPVALYNYLETEQVVQLDVNDTGDDWYELLDGGTRTVTLGPGEVKGERYTVRVTRPGWHDFQITATGELMSDAVRRRVLVVPDGQQQLVDMSSRLSDDLTWDVVFPPEAIDGALSLQVKVYPGVLAQAIEGLDSLLRMPSGCFEQTSSTTYPNILVLQYLRQTEQINPEVELKALEYINLGYQRLLTFEVSGGGFEWFGQSPAHRILTAYGLLEFTDMAEVAYVDPAILDRTRGWLLSQQEADGRWKAAPEGIHEGATNNFTNSDLRATSYIAYALQASGAPADTVASALTWIRNNTGSDVVDPYSLALAASALLVNNPSDPAGLALAQRLEALKRTDPAADTVWWESDSNSFTYGSGSAMTIETTVWSLFALHYAGGYGNVLTQGTNWLIAAKDGFGNWENTQATILTLRFLLANASNEPQEADATVAVFHDDVLAQRFTITTENSDILRQIDLNDVAHAGSNAVRVEFSGTGSFMLQITGTYYRPWSEVPDDPNTPLAITVEYDKTQLATDEFATATVTVSNITTSRADMILVDLGIPPGFDVVLDDFQAYMGEEGFIQKVETTGRQILVYLYGLDEDTSVTFSYRLKAGEPMRAQTPPSSAYLYYESDQRAESEPEMFVVTDE